MMKELGLNAVSVKVPVGLLEVFCALVISMKCGECVREWDVMCQGILYTAI